MIHSKRPKMSGSKGAKPSDGKGGGKGKGGGDDSGSNSNSDMALSDSTFSTSVNSKVHSTIL